MTQDQPSQEVVPVVDEPPWPHDLAFLEALAFAKARETALPDRDPPREGHPEWMIRSQSAGVAFVRERVQPGVEPPVYRYGVAWRYVTEETERTHIHAGLEQPRFADFLDVLAAGAPVLKLQPASHATDWEIVPWGRAKRLQLAAAAATTEREARRRAPRRRIAAPRPDDDDR